MPPSWFLKLPIDRLQLTSSPPCWMTINKRIIISSIVPVIQHDRQGLCHLNLTGMVANHLLSTQLIKPNYLTILPPTQHHSSFRNLPPLSKKRTRPISRDFDRISFVNKGYVIPTFREVFLWDIQRVVPSGRDSSILPARGYPLYPASKKFTKSHIINPLLTKFVRSRWLDIGLVLFLRVYGLRLRLGP